MKECRGEARQGLFPYNHPQKGSRMNRTPRRELPPLPGFETRPNEVISKRLRGKMETVVGFWFNVER